MSLKKLNSVLSSPLHTTWRPRESLLALLLVYPAVLRDYSFKSLVEKKEHSVMPE